MATKPVIVWLLSLAAASATACGSSAAQGSQPEPGTAAACAAQVRIGSVRPPGAGPGAPAPTAEQMRAWSAAVTPDFAIVRDGAPESVQDPLTIVGQALDRAGRGEQVDAGDPVLGAAMSSIDRWVYDTCGFARLDVAVVDGGRFGPLPATLPPGPVAVRFSNSGDPAKDGFTLMLARIRDGQEVSVPDLETGRVDLTGVADTVAEAMPAGDIPGYTTAVLAPGRYLLRSPLGAPPDFGAGTAAAAFTVA